MINTENLMEIQLSLSSPTYRGPKGDKPIKGVDYFTQEDINDIVSQIETKDINLEGYATKDYVDEAVSGVVVSETDPTVPGWAKQPNKPAYTASEVGALPADTQLFSGNYEDLSNKPIIPVVPSNVSAFTNDAGYLTEHQSLTDYATKTYVDDAIADIDIPAGGITVETDPTVPEWAKQATKPTYTANEVGALPADTVLFSGSYNDLTDKPTIPEVPANVSAFNNDAGYLTSHQSLTDYATKSYVETAIRGAESGLLKRSVVQALPTNDIDEDTIYMVAKTGSTGDVYDEYLYVNSNWEHIGSTDVDLTDYRKTYSFPANTSLTQEQIDILAECYTLVEGHYSTIIYDLPFKLYIEGKPVWGIRSDDDKHLSFYTWIISAGTFGREMGFPATEYYYTFNKTSNGTYPTQLTRNNSSISADGLVITYGHTLDNSNEQQIGMAFSYIKNHYAKLTDIPTIPPAPIVIQVGIAGQPSVVDGVYTLPLTITSNNMAEAYAQYQTHPSTVGMAVDLTALGRETKMYLDCESFYRYEVNDGYTYETFGEFNDNSLSQSFGYEFMNVNIHLFTGEAGSKGTLTGLATKSYVDTAIANIPSSGSSYTAGQGISIDNGKISVDFGNEIENGCFLFTQHYDNEDYYEYTADMSPNEINLTSYGEADPETGDQETKSISITGEGITFDDTGDTHTLGVSNGELVFDDSPIGSGGGSSYTAGDGIDIDSNGVISRTDIGLTGMSLLSSGYTSGFSFGYTPSASTVSQLAENLKKYGISKYSGDSFTPTALNEAMGGTQYAINFLSGDIAPTLNWNYQAYNSTANAGSWGFRDTPCFVIRDNRTIYGATSYTKLRTIMGWNLGELICLDVSSWANLTTSTGIRRLSLLMSDINGVIGGINTRIPSAPTTDGNYVLKVSVSSGTPTYSWVSAT